MSFGMELWIDEKIINLIKIGWFYTKYYIKFAVFNEDKFYNRIIKVL
jgi:hypothetical protein